MILLHVQELQHWLNCTIDISIYLTSISGETDDIFYTKIIEMFDFDLAFTDYDVVDDASTSVKTKRLKPVVNTNQLLVPYLETLLVM